MSVEAFLNIIPCRQSLRWHDDAQQGICMANVPFWRDCVDLLTPEYEMWQYMAISAHAAVLYAELTAESKVQHILRPLQGAQHEGDVRMECTASLAMCMLLLLKQHLKAAYSLTNERISSFNPGQLLNTSVSVTSCIRHVTHETPVGRHTGATLYHPSQTHPRCIALPWALCDAHMHATWAPPWNIE